MKEQAMMAELQQQVIYLSTRCANLAAEVSDRDERVKALIADNEAKAKEIEALKNPPAAALKAVP